MSEKKATSPTIESLMNEEPDKETPTPGATPTTGKSNWERILNAQTGTGTKEEYKEHALNYDNKDSTGQIIRGTEGIVGNLDKAVIDIIVGVIRKGREWYDENREGKGEPI